MNIWDEDVKLKTDDVIKLIEEQFKSIKIEEIHLIASGFDNNVYHVNSRYLFRFPRRKIANKLIQKEGDILPVLKQYLSMPMPNPVFMVIRQVVTLIIFWVMIFCMVLA